MKTNLDFMKDWRPEHFELTVVEEGATYVKHQNNYYGTDKSAGGNSRKSNTEQDIEDALTEMLEMKGEYGDYLFSAQGQWYAVYRVLSEIANYPSNMRDFCRRMKDMGYADCRMNCTYDSVAERQRSLPKLSVKVTLWQDYRNLSDAYEKQYIIAEFLMKRLM